MLHDSKTIPQKGKARENKSWQAGWWDFQPLGERFLRPLEWSQSSIIFCAHPVQPLITARHFSSSKQFIISPPTHVVSAPTSYCPPSLISVAPSDDWLFAFFPGRHVEGMGVLWVRGPQIDNWTIKESWPIAHGAVPVAASWLGQAREWVSGITQGSTTRLPPRGPRPPVSDPTLLLVNQNQNITVCYLRQYVQSIRFLTCSTAQFTVTGEGQMPPADSSSTGIKQCFKAAIGLGYNEASVLIAMRSHYVPQPVNKSSHYNTIGPNLPEEIQSPSSIELRSMEWENWGEETVINLFEVQFLYNGERFGLSAEPLQPILGCGKPLIGLDFICLPPLLDVPDIPSPRRTNERPSFYLVSSYLDFENYGSSPKSELVSHSITRLSTPGPLGRAWKIRMTASRSFTSGIVGYVLPPPVRSHLGQQDIIFTGILDTSGALPSAHTNIRRAPIGSTKVLNLADLTDHDEYEASPILCDVTRIGQDVPLNAVLSPNGVVLATISSSLWPLRTSVQSVPQIRALLDTPEHRLLPLAPSLAESIISGRASTDISHLLSLSSTPFEDTLETIYQADKILDDQSSDFSHSSTLGVLGTMIEIYRKRAMAAKGSTSTEDLTARWKTAHELCSLVACNQAFDDCKEGDTYDLDAVWQLVSLSTWIVSLTESLLKECVMSSNLDSNDAEKGNNGSVSITSPPLDSPILLHISHPFFLDNFVMALSHVQKFCAYVKSLTARGETAQIARDITVDLINNSVFDISALVATLEQTRQEVRSSERESCRRALVSCQPTSDMHQLLSRIIRSLTQPSILTKATLFIKPHELVDGLGNLSIAPKKDTDKDVISKKSINGIVASMICSQCKGKTALANDLSIGGSVPLPWRAWEKKWAIRCICGGRWKNNTTVL
ncbi:hypothetical protein H2248_009394 [Termitomyces sp. 'cryptogamus']|nr:hypothetical protein H2248_009394 [Termitomyces sp. 'cryptogamus']